MFFLCSYNRYLKWVYLKTCDCIKYLIDIEQIIPISLYPIKYTNKSQSLTAWSYVLFSIFIFPYKYFICGWENRYLFGDNISRYMPEKFYYILCCIVWIWQQCVIKLLKYFELWINVLCFMDGGKFSDNYEY